MTCTTCKHMCRDKDGDICEVWGNVTGTCQEYEYRDGKPYKLMRDNQGNVVFVPRAYS